MGDSSKLKETWKNELAVDINFMLTARCAALHITKADVAQALGCSASNLARLLSDPAGLRVEQLIALARVLRISPETLIDAIDEVMPGRKNYDKISDEQFAEMMEGSEEEHFEKLFERHVTEGQAFEDEG